ncbi:MAG: 4Fe-4S dicluster domain-containing protein, partial [Promethearchaeota archaeon]
ILDFYNTRMPPKEVVFPRVETLFEFEKIGNDMKILTPPKDVKNKVILGIRPCDAHAFKLLKTFFDYGHFKDDLFDEKMEKLTLIGLGCNKPRSTCFCTSVGGDPFEKSDVDVFLTDLGENYLVEPITEKGTALVNKMNWLENATDDDLKKAGDLSVKARESITTNIDVSGTKNIIDNHFYDKLWDRISETCIGCGTCTFLCPTCHCFDVIDEMDYSRNKGRRIRVWDNCQRVDFTLHTSGHNPRNEKKQRCRQRISHKFCYYPENYDIEGCVGCGRCVMFCPANNDTRSILMDINALSKEEEQLKEVGNVE